MRLAVLGTGPFAVPMFQSLLDSPHEVLGLVTRPTPPPRPREKLSPNPMRAEAERRGLAVFAPESINSDEGRAVINALAPELLVVCDYGQILAADVLGLVPLGGINLHASLLPKYRGAAPIHWALLNGEEETGVTVIHMTPRLDAGPILAQRRTPIGSDETQAELEARLARLGVEPVHDAITLLAAWDRESPIGSPQDASHATSALRLRKEHGSIDWSRTAEQIHNQVRALNPWPLASTEIDGARLLIVSAEAGVDAAPAGALPGTVLEAHGDRLVIAAGHGTVRLLSVKPEGKRAMSAREFLAGHRLATGTRLG